MFALQPEMKVFSGSANRDLAERICKYIGTPLGPVAPDAEHLERTRRVVLEQRPRLQAALAERGAPSPPSQANFILARSGERTGAVRAALFQAGILVRDGAGVGFPGHLRIAVGTAEQNARLLEVWDRTSGSAGRA